MIENISFQNFMGFKGFENYVPFPGITVVVGKNDTGKTGLIKLLYACYKAIEIYSKKKKMTDVLFKKELADKLYSVFQPRKIGLGDLVRKGGGKMTVKMKLNEAILSFSFGESTTNTLVDVTENIKTLDEDSNAIFIPAKEVLTAFNAIKAISKVYFYPGFDDTSLDLISMLDIPVQTGSLETDLDKITTILNGLFGGELTQVESTDRFVFKKGNSEFAMQLTAEGVKRMGVLSTLIRNRQLGKQSVLFMDEPETALHPGAIREMVEMLSLCSKAGIQVFLTTHNYFVIKQLYNIARREKQDILCCSLERLKDGQITSSFANLKDEFPANSIVDEALKMYDEDIKLDLGL